MRCVRFKTVRYYVLMAVTLLFALPVAADDDIMITRDGAMIPVKIFSRRKVTTSSLTKMVTRRLRPSRRLIRRTMCFS